MLDRYVKNITRLKNSLSRIRYNDKRYDEIEAQLHQMEDDFQTFFGDKLEKILEKIHERYCPNDDVLMPIAYFANCYVNAKTPDANRTKIRGGVPVDSIYDTTKPAQLVLLPNPTRFLLSHANGQKIVVWQHLNRSIKKN